MIPSFSEEQRARIAAFLERGWKKKFALSAYEKATSIASRVLFRIDGVEAVEVFGGSQGRCRPGISDIDLLVRTNEDLSLEEEVDLFASLRARQKQLRVPFPMLGEIHVTSDRRWRTLETWNVPPLLWFFPKQSLVRRNSAPPSATPLFSPRARFAIAIAHYSSACRALAGAQSGLAYSRALLSKELGKCIAYATGTRIEDVKLSVLKKEDRLTAFHAAFEALDSAALQALEDDDNDGPRIVSLETNDAERFGLMARDLFVKGRFTAGSTELEMGTLPFRLAVPLSASHRWLARYFDFIERDGARELNLVSPASQECLSRGWAWDRPWESNRVSGRVVWERLLFHLQALPTLHIGRAETSRVLVGADFRREVRALLNNCPLPAFERWARTSEPSLKSTLQARREVESRLAERGWRVT